MQDRLSLHELTSFHSFAGDGSNARTAIVLDQHNYDQVGVDVAIVPKSWLVRKRPIRVFRFATQGHQIWDLKLFKYPHPAINYPTLTPTRYVGLIPTQSEMVDTIGIAVTPWRELS